jgi:hypothetical protein
MCGCGCQGRVIESLLHMLENAYFLIELWIPPPVDQFFK